MVGMGGISFCAFTKLALRQALQTIAKTHLLNRKGAAVDMLPLFFMVEPCKNTTL
jgi:hypothetical protein